MPNKLENRKNKNKWFNLFLQKWDITKIKFLVGNSAITEVNEFENIKFTFKIFQMQFFFAFLTLTLFRMEETKSPLTTPTDFSPVTFANVRISPQTFLIFWFLGWTFLPHLRKISRRYLVLVPNYWTWTKSTPQKIDFSSQILIKLRLWQLLS